MRLDLVEVQSEFDRISALEDTTRTILKAIHRTRNRRPSSPEWCVNWADMQQADAGILINELGFIMLTVDVSEASPDATGLQQEVAKRLSAAGFKGVWVTTSW